MFFQFHEKFFMTDHIEGFTLIDIHNFDVNSQIQRRHSVACEAEMGMVQRALSREMQ